MTQALNLAKLANNVNSSGQLAASAINGVVPQSSSLVTTDFTWQESGGKMCLFAGSTLILSIDSSGNLTTAANTTAYGTP